MEKDKKQTQQKKIAWIKRRGSKKMLVGASMVGLIALMVLVSLFWTPYDPNETDLMSRLASPSLKHPFGADQLGRDVLSRVMAGGQISLSIAIMSLLGTAVIGMVAGLLSGYYGGVVDDSFNIIADIRNSMPTTVIIIVCLSVFGSSVILMAILLAVVEWVSIFRTVRARTMVEKKMDYVTAAYCAGASDAHVIFRYIMPNVISEVIVLTTLLISTIIITEASLSYLGVGVARPYPSWGRMVSDGRDYFPDKWWISAVPALCIAVFVLGINFLGDGIKQKLKME